MRMTYYLTFLATALLLALGLFYLFFKPPNDYWVWLLIAASFNGFLAWRSYHQLQEEE